MELDIIANLTSLKLKNFREVPATNYTYTRINLTESQAFKTRLAFVVKTHKIE